MDATVAIAHLPGRRADWLGEAVRSCGTARVLIAHDTVGHGQGFCLNAALFAPGTAKSRWFVTLDDDDYFLPGGLSHALHLADRARAPFFAPARAVQDDDGVTHHWPCGKFTEMAAERMRKEGITFGCYGVVVYDREALYGIGGFDGTLPMMHDLDAMIRLAERYGSGLSGGEACYIKRCHPQQVSRRSDRRELSKWIRSRPKVKSHGR